MNDIKTHDDLVYLGEPTDGGLRPVVRRCADGEVKVGAVRIIEDGQSIPLNAEIMHLEPSGSDPIYKVTDSYTMGSKGPARVASDSYRSGWDRVFKKTDKKELN